MRKIHNNAKSVKFIYTLLTKSSKTMIFWFVNTRTKRPLLVVCKLRYTQTLPIRKLHIT